METGALVRARNHSRTAGMKFNDSDVRKVWYPGETHEPARMVGNLPLAW